MNKLKEIKRLKELAAKCELEDREILGKYPMNELVKIYNGIGPDAFPEWLRGFVTALHPSLAAVAFIILSPKPIMAVFASVFLAVWAAFVLAISTNKLTLKSVVGLLKVYGSIGFVSVLFIGTNHLFVFLMPNIFNEASLTLNICLLIDEILGYIVVVYTLTPFHGFGYPLGHLFYRLDRRISYGLSKYEEKTDLREEIYSGDYVAKYYKKELHRH